MTEGRPGGRSKVFNGARAARLMTPKRKKKPPGLQGDSSNVDQVLTRIAECKKRPGGRRLSV
jgi:hypothetical protein